jgi:hypothetical protein
MTGPLDGITSSALAQYQGFHGLPVTGRPRRGHPGDNEPRSLLAAGPTHPASRRWPSLSPAPGTVQGAVIAHADYPPGCGFHGNVCRGPALRRPGERLGPRPGDRSFDVQTVALHKIGHVPLGIAHSKVSNPVKPRSIVSLALFILGLGLSGRIYDALDASVTLALVATFLTIRRSSSWSFGSIATSSAASAS